MALSRPSTYPVWATNDILDPVSGQNNVLTPPSELQTYGWARQQFPPRNWFNWLGRWTYKWLAYLGQQESQSVVVSATNATPSSPIIDPLNGGMALISVIDTVVITNFFEGITFIPSSYGGGNAWNPITPSNLTVTAPDASGRITVTGGTGPYIIYGQMKTVP